MTTAAIFPGQGSQSVGMGQVLAQKFPEFQRIYDQLMTEADQILGYKISKLMKEGPVEDLKKTENTQPALLICSTAMSRWATQNNLKTDLALGHSLGEYSALVHAGALSFSDAVKLVHLRGKFMTEALPHGVGGMAALIGANEEKANEVCQKVSTKDQMISPSVFNGPGQVVVSGHAAALAELEKRKSEFGLRMIVRLEVSGPFHCALLKPAGDRLKEALTPISISSPQIPVIFNVTAAPETQPQKIKDLLVDQVSKPVLWAKSLSRATEMGAMNFVELGSGKVLTGLVKKALPDANAQALEESQTVG